MVIDLTGLAIANASLLDEGTAAAEAMAHGLRSSQARTAKTRFFVVARLPSADDRRRADARRSRAASTVVVGDARDARLRRRRLRRAAAVSGDRRRGRRLPRASSTQAHAAGAWSIVAADLLSLALLTPPGEWGADVVRRQLAALRRAAGLRRPARRVLRDARTSSSARCRAASSACRSDAQRQARAAHGAADARAAHPPREGDEQHLHRAGAARGDRRHVRRVPRPGRAARRSRGASTARARCSPRASSSSGYASRARRLLRHGARRASAHVGWRRVIAAARERGDQPARRSTTTRVVRRARRDGRRRRPATRAAGAHPRPPRTRSPATALAAEAIDDRSDERFARTSAFLTHPVFNTHHSETEMLRYIRGSRRRICRSRTR